MDVGCDAEKIAMLYLALRAGGCVLRPGVLGRTAERVFISLTTFLVGWLLSSALPPSRAAHTDLCELRQ